MIGVTYRENFIHFRTSFFIAWNDRKNKSQCCQFFSLDYRVLFLNVALILCKGDEQHGYLG